MCGDPTRNPNPCARCEQHPLSLAAVRSLSAFDGPLRNAIHQLKYYQDQPLAQALGEALQDYWRLLRWPRALVVPVPLSRERLAHRGYNQAELLADVLAGSAGLPVAPGALRRRRDTPSQVGLSANERWNNMIGAFEARPSLVRGQPILLIDDVFTTGATLQACAQALLLEGAGQVYGLTAARAGQLRWQDHSRLPD